MYPGIVGTMSVDSWGGLAHTLLFVDSEHDDDLVAAHANELLDGSDAPSGQLREQDHAVDVVVF